MLAFVLFFFRPVIYVPWLVILIAGAVPERPHFRPGRLEKGLSILDFIKGGVGTES